MKLGLGLYKHMLTHENLRFARQAGATHIVAHLVDYFRSARKAEIDNQPVDAENGWGEAGDPNAIWTLDELRQLKSLVNEEGLELEAIENLDPAHWYDILLDGPRKEKQLEDVKSIISRMGTIGIPILGYNFSLAGVSGRIEGPFARGGALSVGMNAIDNRPVPNGMVWNMVYDPDQKSRGNLPKISVDVLWQRLADFLHAVLPVAEACGVRLAAHPEDPPVHEIRGTPRLVYKPDLFQRLLDCASSASNGLEFCCGTVAEMADGDLYEAVDTYSRQGKICYVHFRNITGKAPNYRETFIDDGDIDMIRVLRILHENGFDGVVIPDHTPLMTCGAPWHAGMAYALGYIKAGLQCITQ